MQQRESRTQVKNSFVQLARPNSNQTKEYKVINVSRGGLCFECKAEDFELNEVIQLNLIIDKQSIHQASGRVCYCNSCQGSQSPSYGLSFLDKFIDSDLVREKHS